MKISKNQYLFILTLILGIYYLVIGIYLNHLGYYNRESIFYIEKTKIVFEGLGNRIKVMGLTSPLLPFYTTFIFNAINSYLAPVIASAIGTAVLFYIIARALINRIDDDFYLYLVLLLFFLHPGLLYAAASGKAIYMVLIFFFLFFFNLLKFYRSNTTFHVSLASICLVILIFCDYKFIWLTLFFVPLVLAITLQSLNLGEKESIFRLFLSFNSPSLRRKLINKTFAIYIILFILPVASVICYKLLNLTHANDLNYFIESPYATWNVLVDKLNYDIMTTSANYQLPELSIMVSIRVICFCPLILIAIYLFRESTYQALTILTPFAFIEFLHIKYDKLFLNYQYYLIFLIMALLCLVFKAQTVKKQYVFKLILGFVILLQLYTGYIFLYKSLITDEKKFITTLTTLVPNTDQSENMELADVINNLPKDSHILMDDAVSYPIAAFTHDITKLTLPYQDLFLSAIETPYRYDDYILIATAKNPFTGYTQLNNRYIPLIRIVNSGVNYQRVYETDNWILYRIISTQ
ncbi:hypothetical protein SNE25_29475 [Mucilaginibacter sabulilitoris]|uniref:Glycosyltransferase RgtA/B/C/D-like domain-containing protein n=1 Tax=Mucilaginibacter sabulilitoris TaxID=1173583 RepID=A0ABZ0TPN8_9SPHI|nr:hypothetical protein [Mucilaginibacter sabulilitoris]WPU93455.1 hypothetical protein SNE25_29475 [Mucilaginibacter sabulilitoris]